MYLRLFGRCVMHRWQYLYRNAHGYIGPNRTILGNSVFECRFCGRKRYRTDHHLSYATLESIIDSRTKRSWWEKIFN